MSGHPSFPMNTPEHTPALPARIDRRTAVRWMLTAAAAIPALKPRLLASAGSGAQPFAKGYGTDPDLVRDYKPGDLWPLTFADAQRATAVRLCDLIIPADRESPAASQVGVVDFIDEWISAPYPEQRRDRGVVLDGFTWLDAEARRRFAREFARLDDSQARAICDDICYEAKAQPAFAAPAAFFALYRDLTAGGFYTTPEGTKDIKFVGNMPLITFDGPPEAVLRKVGLL